MSSFICGTVDSLHGWPKLALDTEGASFHRYYDRVCLIQVSTPEEDVLFDPLVQGLVPELTSLLTKPEVTWVLHGADYDVLSLRRDFDVELSKIFDTMIAARFLDSKSLGLQGLLKEELGISIRKTEQRSDWSRRPLSSEQIGYAVEDTRHLLDLAEHLKDKLARAGRLSWAEEEFELLKKRKPVDKPFDPNGWLKIKGAKGLNPLGQRALRAAYRFRDEVARKIDRAPFRVLANPTLLRLGEVVGKEGEQALARLGKMKGIPRNIDLRALRAAVRRGIKTQDRLIPKRKQGVPGVPRSPMDRAAKDRLSGLKGVRDEQSKALHLDAGFLAPSALLECVARDPPKTLDDLANTPGMTAWRIEAFGQRLLAVVGES